jgi:hypothetical protein
LGHAIGVIQRDFGVQWRQLPSQLRDYQRHLDILVIKQPIAYPRPLTPIHAQQAIALLKLNKKIEAATLLTLMWASAQRPSCVHAILKDNIVIQDDVCTITFVEGKGVQMRRRPFVSHAFTGKWTNMVRTFLKNQQNSSHLFTQTLKHQTFDEVRAALRTINTSYEMRSSRRGALEAIAGILHPRDMTDISGHASEAMVMRYLRWGAAATAQARQLIRGTKQALLME